MEKEWERGKPQICDANQIKIANVSIEDAGNYVLKVGDFGLEFKVTVEGGLQDQAYDLYDLRY